MRNVVAMIIVGVGLILNCLTLLPVRMLRYLGINVDKFLQFVERPVLLAILKMAERVASSEEIKQEIVNTSNSIKQF